MARMWPIVVWLTLVMSSVSVLLARGAPSQLYPYDAVDYGPEEERWLGDGSFYDIDHVSDHLQADGPGGVVELCPPVPKVLPPGGCDIEECSSDRECQPEALMCCYNGCVYTCLPQVLPAPHFDWIREPRRRLQYGRSWLVPGPDTKMEVETCSTTPLDDDSDPLVCPQGYECVIDESGNSAKGIPNSGHCVKTSDNADPDDMYNGPKLSGHAIRLPLEREVQRNCDIGEGRQLLHGHATVMDGQKCLCKEATLICDNLSK